MKPGLPEMAFVPRWSEEGRWVEENGRDVVLSAEGCRGRYRQLGRRHEGFVIIMGLPLYQGEEFPEEQVRRLDRTELAARHRL